MEKNLKKIIHLNHVAELLKQTKHCKTAVLPFKNRENEGGSGGWGKGGYWPLRKRKDILKRPGKDPPEAAAAWEVGGRAAEWLPPPTLVSVPPASRVLCFLPKGEVEKSTANVEAWGTNGNACGLQQCLSQLPPRSPGAWGPLFRKELPPLSQDEALCVCLCAERTRLKIPGSCLIWPSCFISTENWNSI